MPDVQKVIEAMRRMTEATRSATEAVRLANVAFAAEVMKRIDQGEFDNRAHDWMRFGGDDRQPS
jgi:hypothetical protein